MIPIKGSEMLGRRGRVRMERRDVLILMSNLSNAVKGNRHLRARESIGDGCPNVVIRGTGSGIYRRVLGPG